MTPRFVADLLGCVSKVVKFLLRDWKELLHVVCGIKAIFIDRLLADDAIEEVAALGMRPLGGTVVSPSG